jgi:hypothetical protein
MWHDWRASLLQLSLTPTVLLNLLWEGILLIIRAAAQSTLGTRLITTRANSKKLNHLNQSNTNKTIWKHIKSNKAAQKQPSINPFTPQQWQQRIINKAAESSKIQHINNQQFIQQINQSISIVQAAAAQQPQPRPNLLANIAYLCKRIKANTAPGSDKIHPLLLKHANSDLHMVLATITMDCENHSTFPRAMLQKDTNHIIKPDKPASEMESYRPLQIPSIPGKIVERVILDPIAPIRSTDPGWHNRMQFAGRKQHSADQLAFILYLIMQMLEGQTAFIVFLDITSAFDNTWRDLLIHKLKSKGIPLKLLATIKALLDATSTRAKGSTNAYIHKPNSLAQGSPNSTPLFTAFIDDLPRYLESRGIGIYMHNIFLACLMFLDDLAIVVRTVAEVKLALKALNEYAVANRITFSIKKCKVVPLSPHPQIDTPTQWKLGEHTIYTEDKEKFLSTTFSSPLSSISHYKARVQKARNALWSLRSSRLIGGELSGSITSLIINSMITPITDSGRAVASHFPGESKHSMEIADFQIYTARTALGVTAHSSRAGVLPELGWIPDHLRATKLILLFYSRALRGPTILKDILLADFNVAVKLDPMPKHIQKLLQLLNSSNLTLLKLTAPSAKHIIKKAINKQALLEWRTTLASKTHLHMSFKHTNTYKIQYYLTIPSFKGRQLITKIRLNDLPLAAAPWLNANDSCPVCGCNTPESKKHYLLSCIAFLPIRLKYDQLLNHIFTNISENHHTPDPVSRLLLATYPESSNTHFIHSVGLYMSELWHRRTTILGDHELSKLINPYY